MLRIFYGRENLKKDKFIFDSIKGRITLLVPDQFTLQAERDAFFYLNVRGMMDLEIVGISRFGSKILAETGGGRTPMIDKYGRHMLLTKILKEHSQELSIYRGMEQRTSFIEMTNNFISELKQYGVDSRQLAEIAEGLEEGSFMKRKLRDISTIFTYYEEQIEGRYIDTEDYISLCVSGIKESEKIRKSQIWIYGFDAFTPKNREIIGELMKYAPNVNIVLTGSDYGRDDELFSLSNHLIKGFKEQAGELGVECQITGIPDEYLITDRSEGVSGLERELYALPAHQQNDSEGITLIKASNFYNEAETAAAKVRALVRDEGFKYNEIILICNDLETRGAIAKRVFGQYGMELFLDKKKSIIHNPASVFLLSLLELAEENINSEAIFRMLKSGLTDLEWDMVEYLENYARKYRINGKRWMAPFAKGVVEYGEESIQQLEAARVQIMDMTAAFCNEFDSATTVKDKVKVLYNFLVDRCHIPEKLESLIARQEEKGFLSAASETAQVWGLIMDVLDQFVELLGDETTLAEGFGDILRSGLEAIEVGLLPPSADCLIMGTMQRTRVSHVKVMLVMGANEGLLPAAAESDSILSEDEKRQLAEKDIEICKVDLIRQQEEKMAIYKNLSKPSKELWISYSVSDEEGRELKPSGLLMKIQELYPQLEEQPDIVNSDAPEQLLQADCAGREHLTAALRAMAAGQDLDPAWRLALEWYNENDDLSELKNGLLYTGKQADIDKELIKRLYRKNKNGELVLSPSRLEKYSRCPFAHFVQYGLRPDEQRVFEIGGREIGDVYHNCFMELSEWLTEDGVEPTSAESRWMTVTRQECAEKVSEILDREVDKYREGIMAAGKEEQYRSGRLKEICSEVSWILIDHVRRGKVRSMAFEQEFGRGKELPPVTVKTDIGNVLIEGKIDRVDTLEDSRVKIIDYKTGTEKFSTDEARKGYRLQLMLYLRAAQGGGAESTDVSPELNDALGIDADSAHKMDGALDYGQRKKPAGVFYFLINEPFAAMGASGDVSSEELKELAAEEIRKGYKMNGVVVNEPEVIENITGEFSGYSDIIPLRSSSKGISGTGKDSLMDDESFSDFQHEVDMKVREICQNLISGNNRAHPMKTKATSACAFCGFKGICQFDVKFEDCNYEFI